MKNPKDKVIAMVSGCRVETTFELMQKQGPYDELDDGTYRVWNTGFYLNQALELEPEGFFTETILYRFNSGFQLDFESNYRLSKEEQEKVEYYDERDSGSEVQLYDIDRIEYRYFFDTSLIPDGFDCLEKAKEYHKSLNRPIIPVHQNLLK